jgi:serine/threonine-protein kinase
MVTPERVRDELERVLAHPLLRGADRRARLLRYLVDQTLAGNGGSLKESVIAMEVFERSGEYDPKIDSVVRVEMGRLRSRLVEYYAGEGKNDPIRISLPKGTYQPEFIAVEIPAVPEVESGQPEPAAEAAPERRANVRFAAPLVLIAILVAGGLLFWKRARTTAASAPPSVAILPFLNLSGDAAKEYLGDSLTDELTEVLAESKGLRVVARTSAFQFKGQAGDVREIGRKLNVTDLLEGSIQQHGDQVRIVVQLIRCSDGYHIWSHTYETPSNQVREVETEIAASSLRALIPGRAEGSAAELPVVDAKAHDIYLRAAYLFHQGNSDDLRQAIELSQQALAIDPNFTRAHLLIAKAFQNLASMGAIPQKEGWDGSLESMQKAAALEPGLSDVHTYFAYRAYVWEWNWAAAEREFQLAVAAPGSHGNAHNLYGWSLMTQRRFPEARSHFNTGLEIDPMVVGGSRQNLAVDWILERNYPQARRVLDQLLQINPKYAAADGLLEWTYMSERNCQAFNEVAARVKSLNRAQEIWSKAVGDAMCGKPDQARDELSQLRREGDRAGAMPAYALAEVYALLGDAEHAVPALEQAAEQRDSTIMYIQLDPVFDSIRQDARFIALARRIGLP